MMYQMDEKHFSLSNIVTAVGSAGSQVSAQAHAPPHISLISGLTW